MAWIETVIPERATGLLESIYRQAKQRAGKVFQILQIQSQHPRVLRSSIQLYVELMHGDNELRRDQREMIATVVSRVNHCHY